jgi:general secretion pathway protein H
VTRWPQRGFSLIEILIVVFIIGLAVAAASLTVGGDDGATLARKETEDFMLASRFVSEQAVLSSEIVGLFVEPRQQLGSTELIWCYQWQRYRDGVWGDATSYLEQRCLPEQLQMEMIVEGEPYSYDPRKTTPTPVLVFYPSGESTPFELAFSEVGQADSVQRIEVDMVGQILWLNREREREQERANRPW